MAATERTVTEAETAFYETPACGMHGYSVDQASTHAQHLTGTAS